MTRHNVTTARKLDHIRRILENPDIERSDSGLESLKLIHRALPELDFAGVDSSVDLFGRRLSFPLLISSMTGGADEELCRINTRLAQAAQECGVALAVGSQRVMFEEPLARKSFELRQFAPDVPLLANFGAVQLNYGYGIDQAREAVEILEADALILHLNPLQEALQPEGDRNFAGLVEKIGELCAVLKVPVVLKEVGCGFSAADIELALEAGVRFIDLAGRGGTSWAKIESLRRGDWLGRVFEDWGISTLQALRLARPYMQKATFFASGGIRSGVDMLKATALGARVSGIAAPLLRPAMQSSAAVVEKLNSLREEYRLTQFLVGAQTCADLFMNDAVFYDL